MVYGWGIDLDRQASRNLKKLEVRPSCGRDEFNQDSLIQSGKIVCFNMPVEAGVPTYGDSGGPIVLKGVNAFETDAIGAVYTHIKGIFEHPDNDDEDPVEVYGFGTNISYYRWWLNSIARPNLG